MAERREKLIYQLQRFKNFMGIFFKNKMGTAGVLIILGFIIMAIGAPLFTPLDPIASQQLAGSKAAPIWIKSLPTFLGGDPQLSENLEAIGNRNFQNGTEGWHWENTSTHMNVIWQTNFGSNSNESLRIKFERSETGVLYGLNNITVYYDFNYPFGKPPKKFQIGLSLFVNGTAYTFYKQVFERYDPQLGIIWKNITVSGFTAEPSIKVYIQRLSDNKKWIVWPLQDYTIYEIYSNGSIKMSTENWIGISILSGDLKEVFRESPAEFVDPSDKLFDGSKNFRLGVDISFNDNVNDTIPAETNIFVDNFGFYCFGQAYGLLGTDELGRDLFTQLVYGARISLYIGLAAAVLSVVIGLVVGLISGFLGGIIDEAAMRINDLLIVIPFLPLMIVLVRLLGPTIENMIILLGVLGWNGFARVVRSQVLSLKERAYIEAAKSVGAGTGHILLRHILPNVMSLVYVTLATTVPGAITAEAALSFLGFYDPLRMSWGRMLQAALRYGGGMLNWWWVIFPGLCIGFLAMAFILLGFALDDILNPKLRLRR
jgi:ABC-type dipeptide/oligopeptide/nickel transport system permease subunit